MLVAFINQGKGFLRLALFSPWLVYIALRKDVLLLTLLFCLGLRYLGEMGRSFWLVTSMLTE